MVSITDLVNSGGAGGGARLSRLGPGEQAGNGANVEQDLGGVEVAATAQLKSLKTGLA